MSLTAEQEKRIADWRVMREQRNRGGAPFWCDPDDTLAIIDELRLDLVKRAANERHLEREVRALRRLIEDHR